MGNKIFQKYVIIWLIALIMFNVVVFVVPTSIFGQSRLTGSFWTAYVFITLAFLGNLACAFFALKANSPVKLFYNMPLLTISYSAFITMLIVGGIFMAVPFLPTWLGVILCVLILGFNAIAVVKATTAAEMVQNMEEKIRTKTSTMRELTAQAENLIYQAKSEEARTECQKVYEALLYSDPISNTTISDIETKISLKMNELSGAITINDTEKIKNNIDGLINLIEERNIKCKELKR